MLLRAHFLVLLVLLFECLSLGHSNKSPQPKLELIQKFSMRVRQERVFSEKEIKEFFAFPVSYRGFDLAKNDSKCNPPENRRSISSAKDLRPILEHFRLELGKAKLEPMPGEKGAFLSEEIGDCSHVTIVRLNPTNTKIVGIELRIEKVE